jgi:hypothetical protein
MFQDTEVSEETILKEGHQGTTPTKFGLIWFNGFGGEDLIVCHLSYVHHIHCTFEGKQLFISLSDSKLKGHVNFCHHLLSVLNHVLLFTAKQNSETYLEGTSVM